MRMTIYIEDFRGSYIEDFRGSSSAVEAMSAS
jgi:hypothetical protein